MKLVTCVLQLISDKANETYQAFSVRDGDRIQLLFVTLFKNPCLRYFKLCVWCVSSFLTLNKEHENELACFLPSGRGQHQNEQFQPLKNSHSDSLLHCCKQVLLRAGSRRDCLRWLHTDQQMALCRFFRGKVP